MLYETHKDAERVVNIDAQYQNFINGGFLPPIEGRYFESFSPIDGTVFCQIARSSHQDLQLALKAARRGAEVWGQLSHTRKLVVFSRMAHAVIEHRESLAYAEAMDSGTPISETLGWSIPNSVRMLRKYAHYLNETRSSLSGFGGGVNGIILSWSTTVETLVKKIVQALALGNSIVIKPSNMRSLNAIVLMEIFKDIIPPGLVNVVTGYGIEVGNDLVNCAELSVLSFIGSEPVSNYIIARRRQLGLKTEIEVSGNFIHVISAAATIDGFLISKLLNGFIDRGDQGYQPSHILVQENRFANVVDFLVDRVSNFSIGNPLYTSTTFGPLHSSFQRDKMEAYSELAKHEGSSILIGGEKPKIWDRYPGGYFFAPTILCSAPDSRSFSEEIFGPIIRLSKFKNNRELNSMLNVIERIRSVNFVRGISPIGQVASNPASLFIMN